jgi:hypothetical protein
MSAANVVIEVAKTADIGKLAADRLSLCVDRNPAAYLGMATGRYHAKISESKKAVHLHCLFSTPKTTGFWADLRAVSKRSFNILAQ